MTGYRPNTYWLICWKYISPLTMLIIVISSFANIIVDGSGYLAWVAEIGSTRHLEWPPWAKILIAVLVLMSALWIPGIAFARYFHLIEPESIGDWANLIKFSSFRAMGFRPIADDPPAWFPADELREFRKLEPHKPSAMEKMLFCIHEDGSEGLCYPSGPSDSKTSP